MILEVGDRTGARQTNMEAAFGGKHLTGGFRCPDHFEQDFNFFEALGDSGIARQPLEQCR